MGDGRTIGEGECLAEIGPRVGLRFIGDSGCGEDRLSVSKVSLVPKKSP